MSRPSVDRKTLISSRFELILERNENCVYVSDEIGIVKVVWANRIDRDTAMLVINSLVKQLQSGRCQKILVTREDSASFTTEAVDWMRKFLLANRFNFRFKVARIAGVTTETNRVKLFANFIKTAIAVIFPGVKISNFEFEDSALDWLG